VSRVEGNHVPPHSRKPLLGLIALLACPLAGWSGRADASFQIGRPADRLDAPAGLPFDAPPPEAGGGGAAPSRDQSDLPTPVPDPAKPRPGPANVGLQTNGGTTSSDNSSSGGPGSGLTPCLDTTGLQTASKKARGSLILAERHLKPGLFGSRLFRPPR
jgi:hypothetical protein